MRCKLGKVILPTELDAKMALAERLRKDTGEIRYYRCNAHGQAGHWHLSSQEERNPKCADCEGWGDQRGTFQYCNTCGGSGRAAA